MNPINFYLFNNPLYLNKESPFQIGWIDPTSTPANAFINITFDSGLIINIIQPKNNQASIINPDVVTQTKNLLVQGNEQNITVYIEVIYKSYAPQYFSFCFVKTIQVVTVANLYKNFISYLPKNVYNQSKLPSSPVFCDNMATVTVLEQIYNNQELVTLLDSDPTTIGSIAFTDLQTIIASFFPDSGNPNWEYALMGTNYLYDQSYDYNSLLVLLYQTNKNNNTNPYFLALNISKYIYYRLGQQYYVLIAEQNITILHAFILNLNSLSECIFENGNNFPGTDDNTIAIYIINASLLSSTFQDELYVFIRKIVPPYLLVTVIYDKTLSDLGLSINLHDTYWKDPRQNNIACIAFNENILAQALGYTLDNFSGLTDITDVTLTLSTVGSDVVLAENTVYTVTINATPPPIVLSLVPYTEFFSNNPSLLSTSFDGTNIYFNTYGTNGSVTINVYIGIIMRSFTYIIT